MPKGTDGKTAGGKPITGDLITKFASKAEAGYDVNKTLRKRRERKESGSPGDQGLPQRFSP